MKILCAASEAVPYCKTGGLADVVGALSTALAAPNSDVRLVLPLYRDIKERFPRLKYLKKTVRVPMAGMIEPIHIWEDRPKPNLHVYFTQCDPYFDRSGIYGENPGTSFADNGRRYALFSRAVLEVAKAVRFQPDVIHCHDWQTGLVPAYLKMLYGNDSFFARCATVFTIHNMAYQGNFPRQVLPDAGLPDLLFQPKLIEFYGHVSYLKSGLVFADALNTVSPTYANEIRTDPRFGCGLEGVLQERAERFRGILNGLDVDYWNPAKDKHLVSSFSRASIQKRAANKSDLQRRCGLPVDTQVPVLGFVGRLDYQKGVDTLLGIAPSILKEGAQFVSLGNGNEDLRLALEDLRLLFPSQVYVETGFAEPVAHKIYGGADLFLMPSRYEPCGLGQLISMRYGAVPVVTPTGGLLDTVESCIDGAGTGFVAADHTPGAYLSAIFAAIEHLQSGRAWKQIQARAMSRDYSWKTSVRSYRHLYESASHWRREPALI